MTFLFLNSGLCEPAYNMALDEVLLDRSVETARPVLRVYGWTEPAATFGYFQKYAEVARATHLRPLIRRPTGGGIVPHDADWTYSFIAPPNHEWHALKAEESYRRIHEWIRCAFMKMHIETELAAHKKSEIPGACFAGYEKFDLLWRGKKIAGAAQRRNKLGLLIQGSVQPPPLKLVRTAWENAMRIAGQEYFSVRWQEFAPGTALEHQAKELARQKYSQATHNQKR